MVEAISTVFTFYLVIAFINVIIILLIKNHFIGFFKIHPEQVNTLKSLLTVTAVVSFFAIPIGLIDQLLSGLQEIAFVSKMQIIKNIMYLIFVFYIFKNPHKLSVVGFYLLHSIIMFSMVPFKMLKWKKYSSLRVFIPGWDFRSILPLLKYCSTLMGLAIFIILADRLRPVIMSVRVVTDAAEHMADYKIIDNIRMFLLTISSSILAALVPYVSHEFASGNTRVYKRAIQEATKFVWAVGALIGFGVILLSKELLIIYVGADNLYLHKWLVLLISVALYNLYYTGIASVIYGSGRTLPFITINGTACLISLIVCWLLCPITAIGAIVIANAIYIGIIFLGSHFYYLPKYFKVYPFDQIVKVLLPPVFAGLLMLFSVRYFLDNLYFSSLFLKIIVGAISGTLVYMSVILVTYISPQEILSLINKIRKGAVRC
jgi:O-antigen/teichoic acid export membrane protein